MSICYEAIEIYFPKIRRRNTTILIKQIAAKYKKRVGNICCIFCSDTEILRINRQYLQHDYYTDIIAFDYSEDDIISGDLFISLETVQSNSEQFHIDYFEELYRVIIHGILHLCGFNDKLSKEKQAMRNMENEALIMLNNIKLNIGLR